MLKKYLLFSALCGLFAWGASTVRMPSLDNFFLDWHQLLMNGAPPENPFVLIDITDLADVSEESKYAFSEKRLREVLNILSASGPQATGLLLSSGEIENAKETVRHLVLEPGYKEVHFFTNGTMFKDSSLKRVAEVIPESQRLGLLLTYDSYSDKVSRRIMTYFGTDRTTPNEDSEVVRSFAGKSLQASDFKGLFEYYDSLQVFMKIWPREKWGVQKVSSLADLEQLGPRIKGKALLVGTLWRYSFNASPSIAARTKFFGDANIEKEMAADYELVANYMTNWYSGDYIKTPGSFGQAVWIFIGVLAVVGTVLFAPVKQALVLSLLTMVGYLLAGLVMFRIGSYEMDSARVVLVGFVAQYFILPLRFHRVVTRQTKEKYESEARAVEERMKSKTLILAAASEAHMRVAARISHDIRSPLMALRIVGRYLNDGISKEVRGLFEDATSRIDFIAEDTLGKFRNGEGPADWQETSVREVVANLTASFSKVFPSLKVQNEVGDLCIEIPFHSLQRSLSNLMQNSIEACTQAQRDPVIRVEAKQEQGYVLLWISDNGIGIADEVREQLFKPRATFGKKGGTGLGLFQVREELESYGARIFCEAAASGASFIIKIPSSLEFLKVSLEAKVLLVGSDDFVNTLTQKLRQAGVQCETFRSFESAVARLRNSSEKFSFVSELLIEGDRDTAFDFLDTVSSQRFEKVILCTSLVGNKEIHDLAVRRGVLLISRNQIQKVDFVQKVAISDVPT